MNPAQNARATTDRASRRPGIHSRALARPAKRKAPSTAAAAPIDKTWHLAQTEAGRVLSAFEFTLERLFQAFYRWKSECLAAAGGAGLTGGDTAILNVIRMREQPKSLSEVARLLNREDMSNVQYALRKLLQEGLVEKSDGASRKSTTYRVTAKGFDVTERYAELRLEVLMVLLRALGDNRDRFGEVGHFLDLMAGMYDQAAGQVSARRY